MAKFVKPDNFRAEMYLTMFVIQLLFTIYISLFHRLQSEYILHTTLLDFSKYNKKPIVEGGEKVLPIFMSKILATIFTITIFSSIQNGPKARI